MGCELYKQKILFTICKLLDVLFYNKELGGGGYCER